MREVFCVGDIICVCDPRYLRIIYFYILKRVDCFLSRYLVDFVIALKEVPLTLGFLVQKPDA